MPTLQSSKLAIILVVKMLSYCTSAGGQDEPGILMLTNVTLVQLSFPSH